MSTLSIISIISNIVLGISLLSLVFKERVYTFYTKQKELKRDTEKQRVRQIVEEVLKEIVKEDE